VNDPRLLGGKQLLPQRVEPLQRKPGLVLGHIRRRDARRAPCPKHHLRLAQQPADLRNDALSISAAEMRAMAGPSAALLFSTDWLT